MIRFKDFIDLEVPDWVINPFLCDAASAQPSVHNEIIELKNYFKAQLYFLQLHYQSFKPRI